MLICLMKWILRAYIPQRKSILLQRDMMPIFLTFSINKI